MYNQHEDITFGTSVSSCGKEATSDQSRHNLVIDYISVNPKVVTSLLTTLALVPGLKWLPQKLVTLTTFSVRTIEEYQGAIIEDHNISIYTVLFSVYYCSGAP